MTEKELSSQGDLAERGRMSAQKYSALCDQLGLAFRAVQQEACTAWSAWDEAMEQKGQDTEAQ